MELSTTTLLGILDALRVGITVVDENDKIILMNRTFGEMVHQDPAERTGTSVFLCHPPDSEQPVRKLLSELRDGVKKQEEAWVNYDGRLLYEYLYPIRDAGGNFIGVADELHDAADKAELMKRLGDWKELPTNGVGARAPRNPRG